MPNNFFQNASENSPSTGEIWKRMSASERLTAVADCLASSGEGYADVLEPVSAKTDGQVTFTLKRELNVAVRGGLLLDAEQWLKSGLDKGITVWLEPMGDRSSLRKLRGVEVRV